MEQNITFGVEIEGFGFLENDKTISSIVKSLGYDCSERYESGYRRWVLKYEGLDTNDGTTGFELTTPILSGDNGISQFKEVFDKLVESGMKVNNSCGMHVHVGVPDTFNIHNMKSLIQRYRDMEHIIDTYIIFDRRENYNGACGSLCSDINIYGTYTDEHLNKYITDLDGSDSLSEFCNNIFDRDKLAVRQYINHGTVEFRHHGATLDSEVASMWVKFCVNFMKATQLISNGELTEAGPLTGMSEEEINFFNERASYLAMSSYNR